jgi:hypothetical protein
MLIFTSADSIELGGTERYRSMEIVELLLGHSFGISSPNLSPVKFSTPELLTSTILLKDTE